jgi:glucose-6-phosphate 1-dehydrogenase
MIHPTPSASASDNPLAEGLLGERRAEPFTLVIFGASGDLTSRKLLPALYRLHCRGHLPARFAIVGSARSEMSDDSFREAMAESLAEPEKGGKIDDRENFLRRLHYHPMSVKEPAAYRELDKRLLDLEEELGLPSNRLYYLATSPSLFAPTLELLFEHGLVDERRPQPGGWKRVVIEKPFGRDLESARALNSTVGQTLHERQAFRIDHYLGKETVQNLLTFRFANAIFEPLWNRRHIASVQITAAESIGMEGGRGGYYDTAGALRDMVQNHLFQLLCLVAMEPPSRFDAEAIRNEKVKVLRTLNPPSPERVARSIVRGQYGAGASLGRRVAGYREEEGVAADSATETFVAMRLRIDNWRWAGVPFFLRTGKRLPKRATEIAIRFRLPPIGLFQRKGALGRAEAQAHFAPNVLILHLQPNEGISLMFDAKTPGMRMEVQHVRMDFRYGESFGEPSPEAYERLLLDALIGDSTLFTRNDEVEAAWEYISAIHEAWSDAEPPEFPNYAPGDWGPADANRLFSEGEGSWRKL